MKDNENDSRAAANQGMRVQSGDIVLLCSDGLTDLVRDDEILAAYQKRSQDEAGSFLVDLANQRGGHDNITLVSVVIPSVKPTGVIAPPAPHRLPVARTLVIGCLAVILLGVFAGGILGGWVFNLFPIPTLNTSTPTLTSTLPQQATLPAGTRVVNTRTPVATATPRQPAVVNTTSPTPTVTPWSVFTPTSPLPVVTVNPDTP